MSVTTDALLRELLKGTARSFYLTLRVLPGAVRPQIGLAYLLARTSDTIADTELVPLERRLDALHALRGRLLVSRAEPLDFGELAQRQASPSERQLLEKVEASLDLLRALSPADQALARAVLDTITRGQELDLRRFAGASVRHLVPLQNDAELDDYTYRVAGCVGEFWTKLCRAHVFPRAPLDDAFLLTNGVRFGKGLQLVNILRDLPADLGKGRCYLPADQLAGIGLSPADLLKPDHEARLRPVYDPLLDRARTHLAAGWAYTNALPRRCVRVRLACAWPILIGLKTLQRLRTGRILDPAQRLKIGRAEVRHIILSTVVRYPWPAAWRSLTAPFGLPESSDSPA